MEHHTDLQLKFLVDYNAPSPDYDGLNTGV